VFREEQAHQRVKSLLQLAAERLAHDPEQLGLQPVRFLPAEAANVVLETWAEYGQLSDENLYLLGGHTGDPGEGP
jgi:hypothetical protein